MVSLISLAAAIEPQELKPAAYSLRCIEATDLPELSELYVLAYSDGVSHPGSKKSAERISAVFHGADGTRIPQACLVAVDAAGLPAAAIVTTERTFGNSTATTAFIAELFTHPGNRREGLAEHLLAHALQALYDNGHKTVSVTVGGDNFVAIALYLSRDFRRLTPDSAAG
jgi:GNAT superfamily N-acetyltransferase